MRRVNEGNRMGTAAGRAARQLVCTFGMLTVLFAGQAIHAEEANWIWSPKHTKDDVPNVTCFFRKTFMAYSPPRVQITIAADDEYILYVNGRQVGQGKSYRQLDEYNITRYIRRGRNTVAVQVINQRGPTAALVARILLRKPSHGWITLSTDATWMTSLHPLPLWNTTYYNDRFWAHAQVFGPLGDTVPWDRQEDVTKTEIHRAERFRIGREFEVQRVVSADDTGSLIAMAFDEFGNIVASREGGPLLLIYDSDQDKTVDSVRAYCDKVKNVQGILSINGDVYVTGDGPDGQAMYRLSDDDQDGQLESVQTIIKFEGEMGEHGAHGLTLGPDGWIYAVLGNHTSPEKPFAATSPYRGYYEGDLVKPRYEDPGGHAAGRKAPGGMVLRTDLAGKKVQLIAGGLRNVYDLAFNSAGELFVHDSDMESDIGMTWYRPTRICHVLPGAEFGWRSGWAKWPEYYMDSLPAIADTGRGSPTGCVFYDHFMFPRKYQGSLFLADWSEGRILAVHLKADGATYKAETEVFLEGQPLNVTDLDVGPDGGLYFVTGGRGTGGGVYRVQWKGHVPEPIRDLGTGISPVIRQPQLQSAWARQRIANLKTKFGDDWGPYLIGVARSTANPTRYRTRAMQLLQLYGPNPPIALLLELSQDKSEVIRADAIQWMGMYSDEDTHNRLVELLGDTDRTVRRKACEALVRAGQTAPVEALIDMLGADDRFEAWSARRLLERSDPESWSKTVLTSDKTRVFNHGALALLTVEPNRENALDVLQRASQRMSRFVTDRDFIDMLRLMQVAIMQGDVTPDSLTPLRDQLAEEFPAGSATMNRELIRLLAYLQASSILDRYLAYLDSDTPNEDKVHLAMYLRFLKDGWTTNQKLKLLEFMAKAHKDEGGISYALYIGNATRDVARSLSPREGIQVIKRGAEWPDAALGALYNLPKRLDEGTRSALETLDEIIDAREDISSKQLMVGIVAVLARDGQEPSMTYLRKIWDRNPERREPVAMGLAQSPAGENWEYLVNSLPTLESGTARAVVRQLNTVDRKAEDPESFRQVIMCGLQFQEKGARDAIRLLEKWTGTTQGDPSDDWQQTLQNWQQWFAESYPDYPEAKLPEELEGSKWKFEQLNDYITSKEGRDGDPDRGATVFKKALCDKCHRYGDQGEAMGPDLTSLTKRFTRKEVLQSVLFPSHIVSSQYAAKTLVLVDGRQVAGMVGPGPEGQKIVLKSDGEKESVREEDIDEVMPSKASAMPVGLFDELTLEEIGDLFSYLSKPATHGIARRVESP